jgi:hypothetical protein
MDSPAGAWIAAVILIIAIGLGSYFLFGVHTDDTGGTSQEYCQHLQAEVNRGIPFDCYGNTWVGTRDN